MVLGVNGRCYAEASRHCAPFKLLGGVIFKLLLLVMAEKYLWHMSISASVFL
jgi:hypothetical protein